MPVAVLRTDVSKNVVGQISHAFRRLLHIFVLGPCHFADIGVAIVVVPGGKRCEAVHGMQECLETQPPCT